MQREAETIPVPRSIACACCGKPLNALTSFGLSMPVGSPLTPADFCGLLCLWSWASVRVDALRH